MRRLRAEGDDERGEDQAPDAPDAPDLPEATDDDRGRLRRAEPQRRAHPRILAQRLAERRRRLSFVDPFLIQRRAGGHQPADGLVVAGVAGPRPAPPHA